MVAKEGRTGSLGLADGIYLYIKCISNEVLQDGTGDSIQHLAVKNNGKEYTSQAESICCTADMNFTSINFFNLKKIVLCISEMKYYMAVRMHKLK